MNLTFWRRGSTFLSPSEGKRLCYVWYIRYVSSALWLTAADNRAWKTNRAQKWLAWLNAAAVCHLRWNQSEGDGEMTNILHTFLSGAWAANTGQTRRKNKEVCIVLQKYDSLRGLAREDMLNKLLILNNLCESRQWLPECTDTSGMSWSLDLRWASFCQTKLLWSLDCCWNYLFLLTTRRHVVIFFSWE